LHLLLAAEHYPYYDGAVPNRELFDIHRSKISLHHAKVGYGYPTIQLPHTFSKLVGLSPQIYQTVHDGALAFLVVVSSSSKGEENRLEKSENSTLSAKPSYLQAKVVCSNHTEPPRQYCRTAIASPY
jgi:hypothetical protein